MKKYITVAALLAAGTAFANAGVVAVFNCGLSGNAGWMDQDQGWTDVLQSAGGSVISGFTSGDITLSSTGSVLGGVGAGGSFSAAQGATTSPYEIPGTLTTLSQGVFGNNAYDTLWGGAINLWNPGSATLKLGGLEANTKYTVYLFSARTNGDTNGFVTWESTTNSDANWSVWTVADNAATKAEDSKTVQFDGSSSGKNASIVEVTFTTGANQTEVSFSTGESDRFTLNGIVVDQGQTIPEPSAFGLLAGLGALALVASRRRRK